MPVIEALDYIEGEVSHFMIQGTEGWRLNE
jgi:hypothetical protein